MTENSRLILAISLTIIILMLWEIFFAKPQLQDNLQDDKLKGTVLKQTSTSTSMESTGIATNMDDNLESLESRLEKRISIDGKRLSGSINLVGARLDDISLNEFHTEDGESVALFSANAFAEFGWLSTETTTPTPQSVWQTNHASLTAEQPLTMWWTNPQGIKFVLELEIDANYMINVTQSVINNTGKSIVFNTYGLISRTHVESGVRSNMMVHEGAIGVIDGTLQEFSFKDIAKKGKIDIFNNTGWLGFTDKYWFSSLIPSSHSFSGKFARFYDPKTAVERYQADFVSQATTVHSGQSAAYKFNLFVGAKELDILEGYKDLYNIPLFDRAVDFGVLYFITKPIFLLLSYFYSIVGNFGVAILLLTVFIKILLFPLAFKGFKGMNRLKDLQPQMMELKERYKDNPQELQRAMLALYKKEKANPIAGCLPLILQMPVFFALYKVLYVSIEMRNAPFFGWISDLSAPEPITIFNLFGLIPWDPPSMLMIGVLPILMSITMVIQQQLSPVATDPVQAKVMKLLPLIFLIMFASFPSGLVLYITWSNILSILQQVMIKKLVH